MQDKRISILVIETKEEDALLFQRLLQESPLLPSPCRVEHVKLLSEALSLLEKNIYHLILTNLFLSDSRGIETFLSLSKKSPVIPIVILTDAPDEALGLKAIERGAQDYLTKEEIDIHFFPRIVRYSLERHHIQESLKELSFTDELTGVYNRRGLMTLAEQQFHFAKRLKKGFFLFLIDIDSLKKINDTYGHKEGDRIIKATAECLKKSFRTTDIIGRMGGDEFAILALSSSYESKDLLMHNLEKCIYEYNIIKKHSYNLSLSSGFSYFDPEEMMTLEMLFDRADQEMYETKRRHHVHRS